MYELFIEIGRHGEKDLIEIPPEPTAEPPAEQPAEGEEAKEPKEPKEPTEDEKEAYAHQVELINQQNAEIEKHNAEIHELKDKIWIEKRETNFDEMNDCCVMIMQNYRDPPPDEEEHEPSQEWKENSRIDRSKTSKKEDSDDQGFESVPSKVILSKTKSEDLTTIALHSGKLNNSQRLAMKSGVSSLRLRRSTLKN